MIEAFARERRAHKVLKLASLPNEHIDAILRKRGIDPVSVPAVKEALAGVQIALTPADAVAYPFSHPTPGRFGDGQVGVFYSALDAATCVEEVAHHCIVFQRLPSAHARYYHLLDCNFTGEVLILVGHEDAYPDLVSATNSGYPFCQTLARTARQAGIDALHTRSARLEAGTCVPVFTQASVTSPRTTDRFRFFSDNGQTKHEKL
jgi:hypothetical protein